MLDITGLVDLISTGVQGGFGFATKLFSPKGSANQPGQKAIYDNTIEIGRDISPAFGEVLNEFFYGKGMNRDTLRGKITKALSDINLKESEIADKINKLEDSLNKLHGSSYTVTSSAADKTKKKAKDLIKAKDEQKKITEAANLAKGQLDDASTALYENKNILDTKRKIEDATKSFNERIEHEI